jgi:hypothetical protein
VKLRNQDLLKPIQDISKKMYLAMNGRGYARLDMRVRPNNELVILEINPNCGILYYGQDDRSTTDLPISWDKDGHDGFLDRIFRSAILRHKKIVRTLMSAENADSCLMIHQNLLKICVSLHFSASLFYICKV